MIKTLFFAAFLFFVIWLIAGFITWTICFLKGLSRIPQGQRSQGQRLLWSVLGLITFFPVVFGGPIGLWTLLKKHRRKI